MFVLNKTLVLRLFLLIETTFAGYYLEDNPFRIALESTFGYGFYNLLKLDTVLVWKISTNQKIFKPEDYSECFNEFETNETFLIFTQNWKFHFTLYYWSGTKTTLQEKKNVAKYAVTFFAWMTQYLFLISEKVNIAREDQIFESESFIHTLNRLRRIPHPADGRPLNYRDECFPLNGPNLYIVRDDLTRNVIKVPIHLGVRVIRQNTCLVLETQPYMEELYPVTIICGGDIIESTIESTLALATDLCRAIGVSRDFETIIGISRAFKAIVELLEDSSYYQLHQTDYFNDENTVAKILDEKVLLFKSTVTNNGEQQTMAWEELSRSPFTHNHSNHNYLLDSKSAAGVFFVYGDITFINFDEILWSIQEAEAYLYYEILSLGKPIRMRTISVKMRTSLIDFKINELPWPENHIVFF